MKTHWFYIISTLLIVAQCKPNDKTGQSNAATDSVKLNDGGITTNTQADSVSLPVDSSGRVRSQAESIVRREIFPNALFKLNDDNHTGIEKIDLKDGEQLLIRNWGCEYYVLTFRFETTRFRADTTDIRYWMDKAIILMNEIEKGLDAPLNISGGTRATRSFLESNKEYKLGEEIVFNQSEIRDFVTIDRIQKMNDKKFAIEISYAMGPL